MWRARKGISGEEDSVTPHLPDLTPRKWIFVALLCVCVRYCWVTCFVGTFTKSFPQILQGNPKQCFQKGALGGRWGLWALWCSLSAQDGWERWGAETSLTHNAGQQNVSLGERYTENTHMCVHPPPHPRRVWGWRESRPSGKDGFMGTWVLTNLGVFCFVSTAPINFWHTAQLELHLLIW